VNEQPEEKATRGVEHFDVAVVGGGPAGLRAAEVAAQRGAKVAVFDAKPSVGRKFLVAGRGGLNLTHAEEEAVFRGRYRSSGDAAAQQGDESRLRWEGLLGAFGTDALRDWAAGLGVETFAATTGRVYPREMKAAPLLRRWVARLRSLGVEFRMRHRLEDLHTGEFLRLEFHQPASQLGDSRPHEETSCAAHGLAEDTAAASARSVSVRAVVLALGGASWPQTGSDAGWVDLLRSKGAFVAPLRPANCGWERDWPEAVLAVCEGKPLKNVRATAGGVSVRGELLLTRYGLEGGALYSLSQALQEMAAPALTLDFKPDSPLESLLRRLGTARSNFLSEARLRWRLDEATHALLSALLPAESFQSAESTARSTKQFQLSLGRPRPVVEAISTAGGVAFSCLDERLMLRHLPGVFVAGEMLDWEAPTGGYLMQGCFATGTRAGLGAVERLSEGM
jgi:uncharacterized flavoprotein (TIGR03862 family)